MNNDKKYNFYWWLSISLAIFALDLFLTKGKLLGSIFEFPFMFLVLVLPGVPWSFLSAILMPLPVLLGINSRKKALRFWLKVFICAEILTIISAIILFLNSDKSLASIGIPFMPFFYLIIFIIYVLGSLVSIWLKERFTPNEKVLKIIILVTSILIFVMLILRFKEQSFSKKHITSDMHRYADNVWNIGDNLGAMRRKMPGAIYSFQDRIDKSKDIKQFFKKYTNEEWKQICAKANNRTRYPPHMSDRAGCNAAGALYFEDVSFCYNLPDIKYKPDLKTRCMAAVAIKKKDRDICRTEGIDRGFCEELFDFLNSHKNTPRLIYKKSGAIKVIKLPTETTDDMAEEIINLIPEEKLKSRIAEKFPNINNLNCRIYLARYSHKMKGAKEWDKFIDVQINFDEDIDNLKEILSYSKTIAEEAIKKYFEKRN